MASKRKRILPTWMKQQPNGVKKALVVDSTHSNLVNQVQSSAHTPSASDENEKDVKDGSHCDNQRSADYLSESDTDHEDFKASSEILQKNAGTDEESPTRGLSSNVTHTSRLSDAHVSQQKESTVDTYGDGEDVSVNDSPSSSTPGTSGTVSRKSCYFGSSCYRKNPLHRENFAHPGDSDYQDPASTSANNGNSNDNRPLCEYGAACYRKNPQHRRDYRHDTPKKRKARPVQIQDIASEDDGDFYGSSGSDDFKPGDSESDDSFVTSDSVDSGDTDYDPDEEESEEGKKKRKKKTKANKKKKAKKDGD